MTKFWQYIQALNEMSTAEAMRTFGVSSIPSEDALKQLYRKMALDAHPDRGGDEEKMKEINDAYTTLKKSQGSGHHSSSKFDWDKMAQEYRDLGKIVRDKLLKDFKEHKDNFTNHFFEIFHQEFKVEITKEYPTEKEIEDKYTSPSYAGFDSQFKSADGEIIFRLSVHAGLTEIKSSKGLASGNIDFKLIVDSYGLFNNKKQKLSSTQWQFTSDHSYLKDPNKVFPLAKLKKIATGKTSKRKFMKRDAMVVLKEKLNAKIGTRYVFIPLNNEFSLAAHRITWRGASVWSTMGIYKLNGGGPEIGHVPIKSFPETENTFKMLQKIQQSTKELSDVKDIISLISKTFNEYIDSIKGTW